LEHHRTILVNLNDISSHKESTKIIDLKIHQRWSVKATNNVRIIVFKEYRKIYSQSL